MVVGLVVVLALGKLWLCCGMGEVGCGGWEARECGCGWVELGMVVVVVVG